MLVAARDYPLACKARVFYAEVLTHELVGMSLDGVHTGHARRLGLQPLRACSRSEGGTVRHLWTALSLVVCTWNVDALLVFVPQLPASVLADSTALPDAKRA